MLLTGIKERSAAKKSGGISNLFIDLQGSICFNPSKDPTIAVLNFSVIRNRPVTEAFT
jgi:hypothetical protein